MDVTDLNILLPEEREVLQTLYVKWETAHREKNWKQADRLRSYLNMWDTNIVNDKLWHSHFEHNLNRQRRAFLRMRRYKCAVYPWNLSDVS